MTSSDDASFLADIAQILDATDTGAGLPVGAQDATPLADDLSLLLLSVDSDDLFAEPTRSPPSLEKRDENATGPQAPLPSRSTACRMRQREELEHLRGQVRELEEQLDALHQARRSGSPGASSTDGSEPKEIKTEVPPAPSVLWEKIAKRQMTAKQKAEAENAKLRDMLQGQLKIARGLERVLRKRSTLEMDAVASDAKRRKRADSTDTAIYEQLRLGLDRRYRELAAAFEENGLASNRGDLEDVRVLSTGDESQLSVEVVNAKVLPFDFASTSAAVWRCSSSSYVQLTEGFYSASMASNSNDEVMGKFEIPLTVRRQTVKLHAYIAMKRYVESDSRESYVWDSWCTVSSSQKVYDGVCLLDHGWTVVESLATSDPLNPATIVQSCSRIVPDETSFSRQIPVGVLSDVLIASYSRNYATLYETVENALVGSCTHLT